MFPQFLIQFLEGAQDDVIEVTALFQKLLLLLVMVDGGSKSWTGPANYALVSEVQSLVPALWTYA